MPNTFDPYREALVIESATVWPEELDDVKPEDRRQIEAFLHADPAKAEDLEYVRLYTGFCRRINVTEDDVARWKGATNSGK